MESRDGKVCHDLCMQFLRLNMHPSLREFQNVKLRMLSVNQDNNSVLFNVMTPTGLRVFAMINFEIVCLFDLTSYALINSKVHLSFSSCLFGCCVCIYRVWNAFWIRSSWSCSNTVSKQQDSCIVA